MKKTTLLGLLLLAALALAPATGATPYLVCDPPPAGDCTDAYAVTLDGAAAVETPAPLRFDLAGLSVGTHNVTVRAVCAATVWTPRLESAPVPFAFARPSAGAAPAGPSRLRFER